MPVSDKVVFAKKELAGSRLRCLMLTSGSPEQVAWRLTTLICPRGSVVPYDHHWMPGGFLAKGEVQLGKTEAFLPDDERKSVRRWWLKYGSETPHWDIVAEFAPCSGSRPGLLLVEAKAYDDEMEESGKPLEDDANDRSRDNHKQVGEKIAEAGELLGGRTRGWHLSRDRYYQLSNRFAWSWKLASMGIPVVLVYLGFLNADEMPGPFRSAKDWRDAVLAYSRAIVPEGAWDEKPIPTSGVPFRALIRAMDVKFEVSKPGAVQ